MAENDIARLARVRSGAAANGSAVVGIDEVSL
jgi:hypothetical protein